MGRPKGSKNKAKDEQTTEAATEQTTAPVGEPVASGADHGEAIDIKLDLAAKSLKGDIRDALLSELKHMPKPWQQMNETQQQRLINRAENVAHDLVREAVTIAAAEGAAALVGRVSKFSATDKGLKIEFGVALNEENLVKLAKHTGAAVLALIEPARYQGQRKPAETDVVGDLAMPKERADEALLDRVGRGNGAVPADLSPTPHADVSAAPFDPTAETDEQMEATYGSDRGMPDAPAMP